MGGSGGGSSSGGGSGSGGGAVGGGGSGQSGNSIDCYQLIFDTSVASPNSAVLATLGVGSVCDVRLTGSAPYVSIAVMAPAGPLGSLTHRWAELVHCIDQGVNFEAELLSTSSPVRVRVRPV